ncbi:MAG: dTMP kinase [Defluviitaleaceae bacterium]|nr:dTMP kinase [Defluviitaleaceae bacterium]MCL2239551.1 dTMP kinase [Defluviitaleaceae bacterium]
MKFIVFEGLEGSGKTTQLRLLAERLKTLGKPYLATRQPSDNPVGALMRTSTDGFLTLENETMALLVAADRYQHVYGEISPALDAGKYVLCDRYYFSSFACQGIEPGVFARIAAYNALVMAYCRPHITFFLDTAPEECMRRITANRDYGGLYDSLSQLEAIRQRYGMIFEDLKETNPTIVIDGNKDEGRIATEIAAHLGLEQNVEE